MKSRHFTAIALSILSLCVLPSCDKSVAVTGIKLDKTSLSLTEGESANLTATIEPSNATNGTVTWSSTDATIASVNNGLVKALTAGSTTVKVTTADGARTAECAVTVNKKIIAVTGVILDFVSDTLIVDQTKQLTAIVKPDDASDKTVAWSSSNAAIASVDATGKVTAIKAGSATITVVTNGTNASGKTELATCDITVTQPVSGVSLDKTSLTIVEGDTATLTATVSPDDASDKTISWSTSDSAIATVENGKVTAVKEGSAKITVTTKDGGKTAECAITVNKKIIPVEGVTIDNTTASLIMGQTLQLTATVTPDDATDKTVSWSSSNASVAEVDADGLVSAKTAGSATITVTTTDGGKMATCDVTVKEMNIDIPDANFKAYLVQNFDKNGDGEISLSEAAAVTTIDCSVKSIASLEGIQYFTALDHLNCYDNKLTSLDVSHNTALTLFSCEKNNLTNLDVTKNTALKTIMCSENQLTSLDVSQNTALTLLLCFSNGLTSLDVSKNTLLETLYCADNPLMNLDVSKNPALKYLFCYFNRLTSLDLSNNPALVDLRCSNNHLTSLDVSKNTALTILWCQVNQLTSLDVSHNKALESLDCSLNDLTSLNLNNNPALVDFRCSNNHLTSLDVSQNTALTGLGCNENQFTSLDISNNTALQYAFVGNQKDANGNAQWISVKKGSLADSVFPHLGDSSNGNYMVSFVINIPDKNFKAYLVQNFDKNSDGEISEQEAAAVTIIDCHNLNISSLEGVQYFTALTELNCDNNQLANLDVSKNTALTELFCNNNQLASLDVSKNTALTELFCNNNQLANLDVSKNTALTNLHCSSNYLTRLDVSQNTALTELLCSSNQLKNLDVSKNTALTELFCNNNQLASLDVSKNTALTKLYCSSNYLTSLDVSQNTALTELLCSSNQLKKLDLSNNTKLQTAYVGCQMDASGNAQTIFVKRGSLAVSVFPGLGADSGLNYMVSFVINISIPDKNFKAYLVQKFDTNGDGEISNVEAAAVKEIICPVMNISSLEGIQYFTALTELHCQANDLTSLDVSKNTALKSLDCNSNHLLSLDVRNNTVLEVFYCNNNQFTSLDLSHNTALTTLFCQVNHLTNLDLSNNTKLQLAYVGSQKDASGNAQWILVKRESLADSVFPYLGDRAYTNYMVSFVISIPDANFKAYLVQNFDTNGDGEISTAEAAAVTTIECSGKGVASLDGIQYFTALKTLKCFSNNLSKLDLSKNTELTELWCFQNQLTSLDVSKSTALVTLSCYQNKLTSLDVSANTSLTSLICYGNQLSSLDASTMADPANFTLTCGGQTDALGAVKELALVLSTSQKTRWETIIADSIGAALNSNVSVTYK